MNTPKNTVIAFDLHEVLVSPNYKQLFWYGLTKLPKTYLILLTFWPPFWLRLLQARLKTRVPERMYYTLCEHYKGLRSIRDHFILMSNFQDLKPEMINIVTKLKQNGYKIYLFSNIGPETLENLRCKLPLDQLLDDFFYPIKSDNFIHKPHQEFYEKFRAFIRKKHPDNPSIIFVDDKPKNIKAAQAAGLIGIMFQNPQQLTQELCRILE